MRIEKLKIADLNPAPYNPRIQLAPGSKEYENIKSSIIEYDLVEPLVINAETKTVIGGHQRLNVLKEMGREDVDCVLVKVESEAQEKALNIALNNIKGDWDMQKLEALLSDESVSKYETGFELSDAEFQNLFGNKEEDTSVAETDDSGESVDAESGIDVTNGIVYFGQYKWKISADQYKRLIDSIRGQGHFSKSEIIDEIIWRISHD